MKPEALFNLAVRVLGLVFLYQAVHALSAYLSALGAPGFPNVITRPALISVVCYAVAAIWCLYGAPPIQEWAFPESRRTSNEPPPPRPPVAPEYKGPACVACGKPMPPGATTCPACGWTQPKG